jgi:hypothetical protein
MTLAVSIKVNDGVVLAADSATTITQNNPNGSQFLNVYDNANKIFHLHKKLPIGIITWGNGGLGISSIGTLIKDFRKILMDGAIDIENYTIEDISERFKDFILLIISNIIFVILIHIIFRLCIDTLLNLLYG